MEICPYCLAETTSVSQLNCAFCSALLVVPMDASPPAPDQSPEIAKSETRKRRKSFDG